MIFKVGDKRINSSGVVLDVVDDNGKRVGVLKIRREALPNVAAFIEADQINIKSGMSNE
jgi:hypothetical protein